MLGQPFFEQRANLQRQAQQDVAGLPGPGRRRRGQDGFQLHVVERRDHRRGHDRDRNAGAAQFFDGVKAAVRGGGPGLQQSGKPPAQGGDGNTGLEQPLGRQGRQQVEIAQDAAGFGDDAERVLGVGQHFDQSPGDFQLTFNRLVAIGDNAQRQGGGAVGRPGQLLAQQRRCVMLGEQLALEIQPRRKSEMGVIGTGKAIDAAVFAAPVRVDRSIKGHVGRVVPGDQAAGLVRQHLGWRGGLIAPPRLFLPTQRKGRSRLGFGAVFPLAGLLLTSFRLRVCADQDLRRKALRPAVVEGVATVALETAAAIAQRAAPFQRAVVGNVVGRGKLSHRRSLTTNREQTKNKIRCGGKI